MSRAYRALIVAVAAFVLCSATAWAQAGQGVDFTKLSVNGVMVGDTVAAIKQSLGQPKSVAGKNKQLLVYGSGATQFTVQLTADLQNAAFLRNGSKLALDGKTILRTGDAASKCDAVLNMQHKLRQEPNAEAYSYYQPETKRMLLVTVRRGIIQGFVLGSK